MQPALDSTLLLIVDDDSGLARLIEKSLGREGFSSAIALTGEDAMTWLRSHRADLILLDLKLPDYHGPELIARLEAISCKVPFIIITGQGDERVAVEMMKRGALDYILKDVQFLEFLPIVVRRALAQLRRERSLKLAEEAYLKEHVFGNAVFEASGAVLIVLDRGGRIVRSNRACEQVTGYSTDDLKGKRFAELIVSSKADPWLALATPLAFQVDQQPQIQDTILLTKGGERRLISWSITSMPNAEAHGGCIIASGVDITDRRRLEQEILDISDREQQRIGQDMHDGLGQQITASALLSNMLQTSLKEKGLPEAATAQRLGDLLRHAGADVRRISHGLQPVSPEPGSLMMALRKLVSDAISINGAECIFHCDKPTPVYCHAIANHLYRIAQEALQNALKHGRPKQVDVKLTRNGEDVILEVEDDGVGFNPGPRQSCGIGISTMSYRASAIHGLLELSRRKEGGTLVRCKAPDPQAVPYNN